jgi:hypothetical protein
MPIIVPTGSVHDAKVTASAVRSSYCARCRKSFFYVLRRTGKGRAEAPLWIGQDAAAQKAANKAAASAQKQIATGADPVACPKCGLFAPQMVELARRALYSWKKITLMFVIVWFVVANLIASFFPGSSMLVRSLPGLLVLAYFLFQRFTFDPNKSADAARKVSDHFGTKVFETAEAAEIAAR